MRYDLNLLPVFLTLMEERSVTRAAERLGTTQPALSNALTRLRTLLQDPLFIRERRGDRLLPFGLPGRTKSPRIGAVPDLARAPAAPDAAGFPQRSIGEMLRLLLKVFRLRSPALGGGFALIATMSAGWLVYTSPSPRD